jgi:small-conductance mechanosensitive channel
MIGLVAQLIDHFGASVMAAYGMAWPAGEAAVGWIGARLIAGASVLVLLTVASALLLRLATRAMGWIPAGMAAAAIPVMPTLRLILATVVIILAMAPVMWRQPAAEDEAGHATGILVIAWIASAIILAATATMLFRVVRIAGDLWVARAPESTLSWHQVLIEVGTRLMLGVIVLGSCYVAVAVLADHPAITGAAEHVLSLVLIALIAWALMNLVRLMERFLSDRFRTDASDNLRARRVATQVLVLKRLAHLLIILFALSMALMQFESIRHIGTSILASAGLAGIILGFAAQRTLANLLAGVQIALSQPLRIDDAVVMEGEFGRVEEITLTYVVVAVWDQRRLIIPLSRIIEAPFQNWTRTTAQLLGTVELRCHFTVPVAELRAEALRLVRSDQRWDQRVAALQVTDCDARSLQARVLMSAADAGALFDLRCGVREQLIAWLQRTHPQALPRLVLETPPAAPSVAAVPAPA